MSTKQTDFGLVDREALERLREEYDTMQILHAVDRLDQTRNELFELREQLMALHGMAAHMLARQHYCWSRNRCGGHP